MKNKTEEIIIKDADLESLRHVYLRRLILDFSDVFDLIDDFEDDLICKMRIYLQKMNLYSLFTPIPLTLKYSVNLQYKIITVLFYNTLDWKKNKMLIFKIMH